MRSNYKKLGEFIEQIDIKNSDLSVKTLLGVSIDKSFIPSVANINGVDLSIYKIIQKNQFACKLMSVGRDKQLPVNILEDYEEAIVSPAYYVFKSSDNNILDPKYLMMWLSREESDRWVGYISGGDVRGGISWDQFCEMPIIVPSIEKQREIVKEYNIISNRIKLNEALNQKLEETAEAIYKQWFVDFEFPNDNGKPYKSNGGEMLWCDELEKEIPKGWKNKPISDVGIIKAGGDKPNIFSEIKTGKCPIPIYSNGVTNDGLYGFTNKYNYPKNSITISARGTIGFCVLRRDDFDAIVRLLVLIPNYQTSAIYLWQTIKQIEFDNSGSVQNQLTIPQIAVAKILFPEIEILNKYDSIVGLIYQKIEISTKENQKLSELKDLLLSKLATIEN